MEISKLEGKTSKIKSVFLTVNHSSMCKTNQMIKSDTEDKHWYLSLERDRPWASLCSSEMIPQDHR